MAAMIAADKKVVKGDIKANRALVLGENGTYWIAGCSTEDFLPSERSEGTCERIHSPLQALKHLGDGKELALSAVTQGVLKLD